MSEMITFELPEILYKITRAYDISSVPLYIAPEIIRLNTVYYFKDINLGQSFMDSMNGVFEDINIEKNGEVYNLSLKVITNFNIVKAIDLIPNIWDVDCTC